MQIPVSRERLVALWESEKTNAEICRELGISQTALYMAGQRFCLRPRWLYINKKKQKAKDPSEAEIKAATAAIRREWPPGEEERRLVGATAETWTMPRFTFDRRGFVVREA